MRELKDMDDPTVENVRPALEDCFKKTIRYLYTEKEDEIVEELMDKVEKLDNTYESLELYSELEDFSNNFVEVVITTNLQQIDTNPFLNIYDEDGDKVDTWRHGVEIRLPEGEYQIECIAGKQTRNQELELEEPESIHFDFDLQKLTGQDEPARVDEEILKGKGVIGEKQEPKIKDKETEEEKDEEKDKETDGSSEEDEKETSKPKEKSNSRNKTSKWGRKFRKYKRRLKQKSRWKINRLKKFIKKLVKTISKLIIKAMKLILIITAFALAYYFYNAFFAG
jgi:Skp family chaperone for outer membrane proteins